MADSQTTTIRVRHRDKERLSQYGSVGDSFADALSHALDELENADADTEE